jgi:hypothetical protein
MVIFPDTNMFQDENFLDFIFSYIITEMAEL